MNDQELAKQLSYASPNCILIVNKHREIQHLYTPFRVVVMKNTGNLRLYSLHWVQRIKVTKTFTTVYYIKGKWYYYWYFDIVV